MWTESRSVPMEGRRGSGTCTGCRQRTRAAAGSEERPRGRCRPSEPLAGPEAVGTGGGAHSSRGSPTCDTCLVDPNCAQVL